MAGLPTTLRRNYPDGTQTPTESIIGVPFPDPTVAYGWSYSGYEFSHWATNADGTGWIKQVGDDSGMDGGLYYAIWVEVVPDITYLTSTSELTAVADAIRAKGRTASILSYPAGFVSAISAIETGGGLSMDDVATRAAMSGSIYGGSASLIADYAFYHCESNLISATFPTAKSIGCSAFAYCRSFTTINAPMVTTIGSSAFYMCSKLSSAIFPSVTIISSAAFQYCSYISEISFPLATSIGYDAFYACYSISIASFPSATTIGRTAFYNCSKLTIANFPNATSIGGSAFYLCSSLTTVNFPKVKTIELSAFTSCRNLSEANFPMATSIGNSVFMECWNLSVVSLPVVSSIPTSAFARCYNLLSVYLTSVSSVPSLATTGAFYSTPISTNTTSTGGVYGSIFVPASLYDSFLTAKNWSAYSSRIVSV